jgi:hypothetical protein
LIYIYISGLTPAYPIYNWGEPTHIRFLGCTAEAPRNAGVWWTTSPSRSVSETRAVSWLEEFRGAKDSWKWVISLVCFWHFLGQERVFGTVFVKTSIRMSCLLLQSGIYGPSPRAVPNRPRESSHKSDKTCLFVTILLIIPDNHSQIVSQF